jgi:hypothetical protein
MTPAQEGASPIVKPNRKDKKAGPQAGFFAGRVIAPEPPAPTQ